MPLQQLGGERILQGCGPAIPPTHEATDHSTQNAATPRAVSTLPAKFHICRPFASGAATLYTAADKRRTLAYKGADAEAVQQDSAFNPAEDRLCQPRLSQG